MGKLQKIQAFLKAHPKSPEYTRFQWFLKCGMLALSAFAFDMVGQKIGSIDRLIINGLLPSHGVDYLFLCGAQGLLFGLCVWRLLEIYWFGKDKLQELHAMDV